MWKESSHTKWLSYLFWKYMEILLDYFIGKKAFFKNAKMPFLFLLFSWKNRFSIITCLLQKLHPFFGWNRIYHLNYYRLLNFFLQHISLLQFQPFIAINQLNRDQLPGRDEETLCVPARYCEEKLPICKNHEK